MSFHREAKLLKGVYRHRKEIIIGINTNCNHEIKLLIYYREVTVTFPP